MAHQDDLARIMTAEQRQALPEAKGEVAYGASFVEWFAEEAKRVNGETLPQFDNNNRLLVLKQPIGVCAHHALELSAGHDHAQGGAPRWPPLPVVIKPAELTPLTALAAAELALRAGIPAGVLNILTGRQRQLHRHWQGAVRKRRGAPHQLHRQHRGGPHPDGAVGPTVKKMSLELGGNAPFIVFDDADGQRRGRRLCQQVPQRGQTCVCTNRFMYRKACTTSSSPSLPPRSRQPRWAMALKTGVNQGPLIEKPARWKSAAPPGRRRQKGRPGGGTAASA